MMVCVFALLSIVLVILQIIGARKGHIVHCLEGEVLNEQENGDKHLLKAGMTYIVSDDLSSHRSVAKEQSYAFNYRWRFS